MMLLFVIYWFSVIDGVSFLLLIISNLERQPLHILYLSMLCVRAKVRDAEECWYNPLTSSKEIWGNQGGQVCISMWQKSKSGGRALFIPISSFPDMFHLLCLCLMGCTQKICADEKRSQRMLFVLCTNNNICKTSRNQIGTKFLQGRQTKTGKGINHSDLNSAFWGKKCWKCTFLLFF